MVVKKSMFTLRLFLTFFTIVLSGCADLRFYNAAQDEIVKKAAVAINEAEIGKALAPERNALAALAKAEQDAVRRDQFGRRDRRLIAWLSATDQKHSWASLDTHVSKRIEDLTGASITDLIKQINAIAVLKSSREAFDFEAKKLLNVTGGVELTCPIQESQQYPNDPEKKVILGPAYNACSNLIEAQQNLAVNSATGGLMKTLSDELNEVGDTQKKIEDNLKNAVQRYNAALKALKEKPAGDPSATADVKAALEDLEKLPPEESVKKIMGDPVLKRLVDEGKIAHLEKKRELVRSLLSALDTGKPPESANDDQKNIAAVGALWHAIGDQPPPPLTGLLMESEFLRQESKGLQMQVKRAKQQIQLKQAKLASMQDELNFILHSEKAKQAYIDMGSRCPSAKSSSIYEAWEKASMSCRNLIAQRLISVLNAMTFGETQQELIDYQLIALGHDAALDSSEVAINQLDSLIRLPITQLSKAYASGLTPQQLGGLINALGLGAIAKGVN